MHKFHVAVRALAVCALRSLHAVHRALGCTCCCAGYAAPTATAAPPPQPFVYGAALLKALEEEGALHQTQEVVSPEDAWVKGIESQGTQDLSSGFNSSRTGEQYTAAHCRSTASDTPTAPCIAMIMKLLPAHSPDVSACCRYQSRHELTVPPRPRAAACRRGPAVG